MNGQRPTERPDELDALRRTLIDAGLTPEVVASDHLDGLATPEEFLRQMKESDQVSRVRRRRRVALIATGAVAASFVLLTTLQPWKQSAARAETPPILTYQFAKASQIAYAPGKDPRHELRELARTASAQPPLRPDGNNQHIISDAWFAQIDEKGKQEGQAVIIPQVEESWLLPDGSLRRRETSGKPLAADGRGLISHPTELADADETDPAGTYDPKFVADLPRNARAVKASLLKRGNCPENSVASTREHCIYEQIVDLFSKYVIPPRVAAAFWQIVSGEDDFRLLGAVTDRADRAGVGISLIARNHPQYRLVMIIDPQTGQLLGTEEILIKQLPDLKLRVPAIFAFTAIRTAEYSKSAGQN